VDCLGFSNNSVTPDRVSISFSYLIVLIGVLVSAR